jgi:hypothetical protein
MVTVKDETTAVLMGFPFHCHNFDGSVKKLSDRHFRDGCFRIEKSGRGSQETLEKTGFRLPRE